MKLKGKQLKEGMWVVVVSAKKGADVKANAVPVKVVCLQFPCVIFEVVRPTPQNPLAMAMMVHEDEKALPAYGAMRHTFAANVKKCTFQEVSEAYVEAYNRAAIPVQEPSWLRERE